MGTLRLSGLSAAELKEVLAAYFEDAGEVVTADEKTVARELVRRAQAAERLRAALTDVLAALSRCGRKAPAPPGAAKALFASALRAREVLSGRAARAAQVPRGRQVEKALLTPWGGPARQAQERKAS